MSSTAAERLIPLILRPQAWLHRRHYGAGAQPYPLVGSDPAGCFTWFRMFVGYLERRRSPLDPVLRSLVSARIAQLCHCEFCIDITSMKLARRAAASQRQAAGGRRLAQQRDYSAIASGWRWNMPKRPRMTPPAVDDALRRAAGAAVRCPGAHRTNRADRPAKFISAL